MTNDERLSRLDHNRPDRGRPVQLDGRGEKQFVVSRRSDDEIYVRSFKGEYPPIRHKAKHYYDREADERVMVGQVFAIAVRKAA